MLKYKLTAQLPIMYRGMECSACMRKNLKEYNRTGIKKGEVFAVLD
jgi:hypothetical protein